MIQEQQPSTTVDVRVTWTIQQCRYCLAITPD